MHATAKIAQSEAVSISSISENLYFRERLLQLPASIIKAGNKMTKLVVLFQEASRVYYKYPYKVEFTRLRIPPPLIRFTCTCRT